jgi:hypothetical protein
MASVSTKCPTVQALRLRAALDWIRSVVETLSVIALDADSSGDGAEQVFAALQAA